MMAAAAAPAAVAAGARAVRGVRRRHRRMGGRMHGRRYRGVARRVHRVRHRVMRARPRGRLLAPRLMSAVYRTILQQMLVEGWVAPRRRIRIGKARLLWLVARSSVFG